MSAEKLNTTAGTTTPVAGGAAPANTPPTNPGSSPGADAERDRWRIEGQRMEQERIASIDVIRRDYGHLAGVNEACDAAVRDPKITTEAMRAKVLELVKAGTAPTGTIEVGSSGFERRMAGTELVLLTRSRSGIEASLRAGGEKGRAMAEAIGYESADLALKAYRTAVGEGLARMRLMQVAEACAVQALGGSRRQSWKSDDEVLASAFGHSSSDFPKLLGNVANKSLMAAFVETPTTFDRWCSIGSSRDFKTMDLITLSENPNLTLVPEGADVDQGSVNERMEQTQVRTYGKGFSFTRQMMINDDLGGISRWLQGWGIAAARLPESLAYGVLTANAAMADGVALFHSTHNNLESATALSEANLAAAATKMMTQRGFGADPAELAIDPKFLLVPSNLIWEARRILKSQSATADNKSSGVINPVAGLAEPIASPYLYRNSTTAWYLTADPSLYPVVEVTFLNGNRSPIVTRVGDGSILGQKFEIVFDCAAKSVQFEGAVKNPGA